MFSLEELAVEMVLVRFFLDYEIDLTVDSLNSKGLKTFLDELACLALVMVGWFLSRMVSEM